MRQSKIWKIAGGGILAALILAIGGCAGYKKAMSEDLSGGAVTAESEGIVWEEMYSPNGQYIIRTILNRESGIEVYVNDERVTYDAIGLEYNPIITDNGHFGYILEHSGDGYKVIIDGETIFETKALLHYLTVSETKALFAMADNGENVTRFYLVDLESKEWVHINSYPEEYVEEVTALPSDCFVWITSRISEGAEKRYYLYYYDPAMGQGPAICIKDSPDRLVFYADTEDSEKSLTVDRLKMDENAKFLFNAYRVVMEEEGEPFSRGNDYRGRIAWNESYRIRGLTELYRKTKDDNIHRELEQAVAHVMLSGNEKLGLEGEFLPSFLWCEKAYSIEKEPVSIIVDNCEILSALLFPLTEGIIDEDFEGYGDIIDTAECAFDFYESYYADGHYYLPYGYPMTYDGAAVPWNWQNSMAEVSMDLYLLTRKTKYLDRCQELVAAFKSEWVETDDRIYWHYWPQSHYDGWFLEDNVSSNTPSLEPLEDKLFEDTSHAGISLRFLWRYHQYVDDDYVTEEDLRLIENNMNYFCTERGFSRFVSGDMEYAPISWVNSPGVWWAYLSNDIFENFVAEGSLNVYAEWDNTGRMFANAYNYSPQKAADIHVSRWHISFSGGKTEECAARMEMTGEFDLDSAAIAGYVREIVN